MQLYLYGAPRYELHHVCIMSVYLYCTKRSTKPKINLAAHIICEELRIDNGANFYAECQR